MLAQSKMSDATFRIRTSKTDEGSIFAFSERLRSGRYVFVNQTTGRRKFIEEAEFERMWGLGDAALLRFRSPEDEKPREHIDPAMRMDLSNRKLSNSEREKAEKGSKKLIKARTYLFYMTKWDENPQIPNSEAGRTMLKKFKPEAEALGLPWFPSLTSLQRARLIGQPGARRLALYVDQVGVHDPSKRHPPFVLAAKEKAIEYYWNARDHSQQDAIVVFRKFFAEGALRLQATGITTPKPPDDVTVRRWLLMAETKERHATKWGQKSADRNFEASRPAIAAEHALQYVMIDHTRCDKWAIIEDKDGNEIFRERPWIVGAVDVYSDMTLALILTLEPPSLSTVTACLKEIIRPKVFLEDRYGDHKGATSGWGAPSFVVVDNAWENSGKSFQDGCESQGIGVKWAPVRTGEYKTYIEHLWDVLNTQVWHKGPGAIPYNGPEMSRLGLDPRSEAQQTIDELQVLAWDYLVTVHHLEHCDRRNMPRALAWTKSINKVGRNMLDDVNAIDRALGMVEEVTLTRDGVVSETMRFHDPILASQLLGDLIPHSQASQEARARQRGSTIRVKIVKNPSDCSFIDVWNFVKKEYVRLPNMDSSFSENLSWSVARQIRQFASGQNAAFHSDIEKLAARYEFIAKVNGDVAIMPFAKKRKVIRVQQQEARLVPGAIVEAIAEPRPMGTARSQIPNDMAATYRDGNGIPAKGIVRGRPKKKTLNKNGGQKRVTIMDKLENEHRPEVEALTSMGTIPYVVEDAAALLAQLARELD